MILILANRSDYSARALASTWGESSALLVTPGDLSRPGWKLPDGSGGLAAATAAGVIHGREISGVLTRMPSVGEAELFDLIPADRPFVAAEMTAFLLAWLSRLDCPVVNRPSPTCLCGPYWRHERWVWAARQAGIPVDRFRRDTRVLSSPRESAPAATVLIVGNRCFGDVHSSLKLQAQQLAQMAGFDLLSVEFSDTERGARFIGTSLWPDLSPPEIAAAVMDHLEQLACCPCEAVAS